MSMNPELELVAGYADILQVGSPSMQNFTLLEEVGRCRIPVRLKRGMSATIAAVAAAVLRGPAGTCRPLASATL
jgi:3-deoxy-D-arabino-heptulosonate 7-phosphate (DAHP) synthase